MGRQSPVASLQRYPARVVVPHALRPPTSLQVTPPLRATKFSFEVAATLAHFAVEAMVLALPPTAALERRQYSGFVASGVPVKAAFFAAGAVTVSAPQVHAAVVAVVPSLAHASVTTPLLPTLAQNLVAAVQSSPPVPSASHLQAVVHQ